MVVEVPRGEAPGGALGSGRPSGYLALRTLTHATSTRARAYDVRHIMFGTLFATNTNDYPRQTTHVAFPNG